MSHGVESLARAGPTTPSCPCNLTTLPDPCQAVQIVYDPDKISLADILRWFWQSHDPTQGMGQGNDRGTQYRSGAYYLEDEQRQLMDASKVAYGEALRKGGHKQSITTEVAPAGTFYYAEPYHQQYLARPGARPYCSAEPLEISLPPFEQWAPVDFTAHFPKLPDEFWNMHAPTPHCVIRSPNAPIAEETYTPTTRVSAPAAAPSVRRPSFLGGLRDSLVGVFGRPKESPHALSPTPSAATSAAGLVTATPGVVWGGSPVSANESIMSEKAHGTSDTPVQSKLRFECDVATADRICNFNRHYAEHAGYMMSTKWIRELHRAEREGEKAVEFFDSNTGEPLFRAPLGRNYEKFIIESKNHGWPSFRDAEVNWGKVRVLPNGECISVDGTHLGHNLPDDKGNRYCINLVSVAGFPNQ